MEAHQVQVIERSDAHVSSLRRLIHPPALLQRRGFILTQLNKSDLEKKKRCGRCHKGLPKRENRRALQEKTGGGAHGEDGADPDTQGGAPLAPSPSPQSLPQSPAPGAMNIDQQLTAILQNGSQPGAEPKDQVQGRGRGRGRGKKKQTEEVMHCQSHPGKVQGGRWTCCQQNLMSKPCTGSPTHTPRVYAERELEDYWRFYTTPYRREHTASVGSIAIAVSIDCEMGTNDYGESELIRVSVVDYFSGAVLLDKLVFPDIRIRHWNTRFSGVSARDMHEARRAKTCLLGRDNARQAIWQFVSPETVVVGHAVHGDLASLRWIHGRVVDTFVIEDEIVRFERARREKEEEERREREEAEGKDGDDEQRQEMQEDKAQAAKAPYPALSLKALTKERLDRIIQVKGRGHDSVEDALAARDLLHWHIVNRVKDNW